MFRKSLLRFVYNNNPFYLISASVLLYGLNTSMPTGNEEDLVWILSSVLAGYTLLMSVTAMLIVRLGKVWDDARTILLVISLLYFAISASFDQLCITHPKLACLVLSLGFMFCMLTTELTILGLKLRMPACYRLPLYLLLGLIFGFPLSFAAMGSFKLNHDAHWILLSFPVIAAIAITSLIPAARRGRKHIQNNGTPWVWPYYPWSLFVVLVVGLCGRCALLSIAFEPSKGLDSIFDLYMLVPIYLAVLVLLLEIAIKEQLKKLQQWILAFAMLAIPMAMSWNPNAIQYSFLREIMVTTGSPLWMTSIALVAFYCIAWYRKVDQRAVWVSLAFVMTAICAPTSNRILSTDVSIWPIFCLSVFMFLIGLREFHSRRFFASAAYSAIATGIFVFQQGQPLIAPIIGADILLIGMVMIGIANVDLVAKKLCVFSAALILLLAMLTVVLGIAKVYSTDIVTIELAGLFAVAASASILKKDILMVFSMSAVTILATVYAGYDVAFRYMDQAIVVYVVIALLCFMIGALISALKAGLSKSLTRICRRAALLLRSRITADFG